MAFQQFLDVGPLNIVLRAGLYPLGSGKRAPWEIRCSICPFVERVTTLRRAQRIALRHDYAHALAP